MYTPYLFLVCGIAFTYKHELVTTIGMDKVWYEIMQTKVERTETLEKLSF